MIHNNITGLLILLSTLPVWHWRVNTKGKAYSRAAVSANGTPSNVIGQVTLPITLDHLNTHKFTVICHLTVYCLLDADCFEMHNARQFIKI